MRSSSQILRKAPAVVVHGIRADMVSVVTVRVHSWLGAVEARTSKGAIIQRCTYTMVSTGVGDTSRIGQHVRLEMVSKAGGVLPGGGLFRARITVTLNSVEALPSSPQQQHVRGWCQYNWYPRNLVVAGGDGTLRTKTAVKEVV